MSEMAPTTNRIEDVPTGPEKRKKTDAEIAEQINRISRKLAERASEQGSDYLSSELKIIDNNAFTTDTLSFTRPSKTNPEETVDVKITSSIRENIENGLEDAEITSQGTNISKTVGAPGERRRLKIIANDNRGDKSIKANIEGTSEGPKANMQISLSDKDKIKQAAEILNSARGKLSKERADSKNDVFGA